VIVFVHRLFLQKYDVAFQQIRDTHLELVAEKARTRELEIQQRAAAKVFPLGDLANTRRKQPFSSLSSQRPSELAKRRKVYINVIKSTAVNLATHLGLEPLQMSITINGIRMPIYVDDDPNAPSIPMPAKLLDDNDKARLKEKVREIQAARDKFYITERVATEMFHLFPSAKGTVTTPCSFFSKLMIPFLSSLFVRVINGGHH
jgi:hypothetical protein